MKAGNKIYRTGFGDQAFEINCNNDEAYSIAHFLFLDFPGSRIIQSTRHYCISVTGATPTLSLWDGDKSLYSGDSRYQLAYILMNEVIFHCINHNTSHHAIHAGCVYRDDRCFVLPGQSGNGKSTLTSWLTMNGFQYLTDELVFLNSEAGVWSLTRPINLKVGPGHPSWLLSGELDNFVTSKAGSMIPHRLLNAEFNQQQPKVTDIIFPQFSPDTEPELKQISSAKASLYLLRCHVNARNHEGHGISEMASIVKQCRSYTLSYSSFDDLQYIFKEDSELFA